MKPLPRVEPSPVDERSERIQRRLEWPVIVAALLTIPTLILQESDFGAPWQQVGDILSWATWLVFLGEVLIMLALTTRRRAWARRHVLDLAIVILTPPFAPAAWQAARIFRALRLLRLVRIFRLREVLSLQGIKYAALVVALIVIAGGAAFAAIEKTYPHTHEAITTWDGIWWAVTTVTTVAYGDIYPTSDAGRLIAMTITFAGISFALLTALFAQTFLAEHQTVEGKEDVILAELQRVSARLEALEARGTQ